FGVLVTSVGAGMGMGMASLGQITKFIDREKLFPIAMLSAAAALFVDAAMPNIVLASVATVVMGVFVGITWVTGYALLQENVADEFRGRTFGALTVMSRLGLFASLVGFPAVAGALGGIGLLSYGRPSGPRFALWHGSFVVVLAGGSAR